MQNLRVKSRLDIIFWQTFFQKSVKNLCETLRLKNFHNSAHSGFPSAHKFNPQ
tara:strand:- start:320 stop:478 length:159 start_codon:yes stop_codon:yes gene_type:complete